ncbi:glycosyltransferase family 8 protein [Actinobacillus equuli subsp. equuli]|uniref:Glycosyl transferase family protein n=1 Tax=Actinobacillus equuli TaxID=718 RepID=A0AAX3FMM8_ACTEU|nr:glycosyltransferase family 8 protein [Actinobacillus equuli]AIZ80113.1 hypothetical protein ACEE_10170 [Actinobacillus equuli subsp. equuli]WGE44222.1 glycosyltransferase family 8 protein [Actinobacillus equuli subsp. equuli]WGE54853.1 glycosyltransferase family 8 protein [Actinobacillus equuli subsp. equuli]WGE65130.1 glycosyltransferase family 8 protein [Actinobacillus equuli subsp. equuli]WGE79113.1 glycosyltransferase family 8 protein [Actinobacillus equuli subsp. equuli]
MTHSKQTNYQINIVLAANHAYAEQIITLIKSASYFHKNINFYLLHNAQFAQPWFDSLNKYLQPLNSQIISCQVNMPNAKSWKTIEHITEETFFRYLLGQIPVEKLLYLDCDLIIDGDISSLYDVDLKNDIIAAVPDMFINYVEHYYAEIPDFKPYFNAGVLLINVPLWNKENIEYTLCELTSQFANVIYADQDILNIVFHKKWKILDKIYNYQVGARHALLERGLESECLQSEDLAGKSPVVIHYTSHRKPWKGALQNNQIFAEKYWFYYNLSWEAILSKHQ